MEKRIAIVEIYIHHMTGKEVRIIPPVTIGQHLRLDQAAAVAKNWADKNNVSITYAN